MASSSCTKALLANLLVNLHSKHPIQWSYTNCSVYYLQNLRILNVSLKNWNFLLEQSLIFNDFFHFFWNPFQLETFSPVPIQRANSLAPALIQEPIRGMSVEKSKIRPIRIRSEFCFVFSDWRIVTNGFRVCPMVFLSVDNDEVIFFSPELRILRTTLQRNVTHSRSETGFNLSDYEMAAIRNNLVYVE